jgi:hypothetical protein
MPKEVENSISLPFILWSKNGNKSGFSSQAKVIFSHGTGPVIQKGEFEFYNSTIKKQPNYDVNLVDNTKSLIQNGYIPFFSLFAVLILIIFRNRFFGSFQKYFLNLKSNYEIDFNFQKIGAIPVLIGTLFVLFSFIDLTVQNLNNSMGNADLVFHSFKISFLFFAFPLAASLILFFLLNLSLKLFPIFFSDLKVLFFLAIITLIYTFSAFGSQFERLVSAPIFIAFSIGIFFGLRSFLLYKIFQKAYRFKFPITVFYICTLNLQTILVIKWLVDQDFFRLL